MVTPGWKMEDVARRENAMKLDDSFCFARLL